MSFLRHSRTDLNSLETFQDCEGSIGGNLHPFHTELCSQCCHTDLCNAYLCEQKLPNGMICAKCDDVSDVDTCLKVAFCQGGEACTGTTACCDNADLCNLNLTKTISNPRQVSVTSTPSSTTSWPSATDSETIATFESTVGVDHVTPTTVTFFSSVDNNTTWGWTVCPHHQYPWRPEHSVGDEYAWCHRKSRCDVRGKSLLQQHGRMVHIRFSDDGCNSGQQDNTVESRCATRVKKWPTPSSAASSKCADLTNLRTGLPPTGSCPVCPQECQDTELDGSRHVHETVECSECCYGDLCNDKLCKAEDGPALCCLREHSRPTRCLRFKASVPLVRLDCTGDVVCCNDTNLCNVKGGSNVHAPSSGKTTPPTTPVSITGPPTDLFLSSSFTEQSSTSSSNADTSSSEFSTSASSSILGSAKLAGRHRVHGHDVTG
ncbi:hypothetical protein C0Q70_03578 [Pomacea canaliculata]|uniref:Uncharacterized protein n=1 Tax=Pomacea canaliculata TaxID=400727 RepID=A0A2T7PT35_POMCA|nr:hypothetical protein C0Q70_03578 [Pomacea canaliculata]